MEIIKAILTYKGDLTGKFTTRRINTPFRLTTEGNTEQEIDCFRGFDAKDASILELTQTVEPFILKDARKNGTVLSCKWIVYHENLT